ncbi:NADH-quinone oxidoreductase subunit L [Puia dinghuensis]|uniref:NADH:ubiquinone oxidoreductase subunit L n=1 Tax=Puia dinghuensis TaxID=1792502 RepID=A0A8J2UD91_9BACT|nr:NADH-quinone oxidoreductase subunit L [Puia dinghuensis]GGB00526.1 NADH:ubiquinone oxidoreductase subunit L [Puia dinghuensis]
MNELAYIPALPLLGFLVLALGGRRMSQKAVAITGAGSVCAAALLTMVLCGQFFGSGAVGAAAGHASPASVHYDLQLGQWFHAGALSISFGLRVDSLSLVFMFIITFVGALIHLYSTAFMRGDRDYARFFACMNLFVCAMLILVMADNLVLLYLGWEGVGLCSYLLIGFWYDSPANCLAANKAFIITRIGDTALLIGLFLLFKELATLDIAAILRQSPGHFRLGSPVITLIALLFLAGGMGKSAQLPLQTWLPDAMAGPSPVSALIHAATMVTAGVYLIARMHVLFQLSPLAMTVTAITGALTLLVAACSAMVQTDIKRILAYSTISQIGYMFLALGVGAYGAAIFHFFTHAFFKALLFLAAGAVIESLHHEHNIFRMGGLKDKLPVVYWTFLAGAASLAALPLVSAGFYSKEQILWYAWRAANGGTALWLAALAGAVITAFYSTRLLLVVFWGEAKTSVSSRPGRLITIPLIILAFLSLTAGFVEWPHNLLPVHLFSGFLQSVLPAPATRSGGETIGQLLAVMATLAGIGVGYQLYHRQPEIGIITRWQQRPLAAAIRNFLFGGWGFDRLYDTLFVRPLVSITRLNRADIFDQLYVAVVRAARTGHRLLSASQNGSLRWYAVGVLMGILFILTLLL